MNDYERATAAASEAMDELTKAVKRKTKTTLADGTEVETEEGEVYNDGKNIVITPVPAEALLEIVGPDDPRLEGQELQSLDEQED